MNRRRWISHILQLLGLVLLLASPPLAQAKFIIEFTDGRRMTVSNYEQTEEAIKVYTTVGSFAFRRSDVAHITALGSKRETRSVAGPPEQVVRSPKNEGIQPEQLQQTLVEGARSEPRGTRSPRQGQLQKTLNTVSDTPEAQTLVWSLEYGIYRLRYVFALLVGIKVLKLFLAASVK